MTEKPIERLNYYNGQRLEAEDFRLEQEYHMRIQRWLTKSLFSPGVADGLEVFPVKDEKGKQTKVRVTPGLALDDLGRAIINANDSVLTPQARYLCVRYAERKERVTAGSCSLNGGATNTVASWRGPERVLSEAEFVWRSGPPRDDTRELVIAVLELGADCVIERVASGAAKFAVATQVSQVFQYALEGEKDIDERNPKEIIFHINGRRPTAIYLELQAFPISSLHYTELPLHKHSINDLVFPEHDHSINNVSTDSSGDHDHHVYVRAAKAPERVGTRWLEALGGNFTEALPTDPEWEIVLNSLSHSVLAGTGSVRSLKAFGVDKGNDGHGADYNHVHAISNKQTSGVIHPQNQPINIGGGTLIANLAGDKKNADDPRPDWPVISAERIGMCYIDRLQVAYDGIDITSELRQEIANANPQDTAEWSVIGSGNQAHPLVTKGTGLVRIDLIENVSAMPGRHRITLSTTGTRNGGCIHYNLYIE